MHSSDEIETWIKEYIAKLLHVPSVEVDPNVTFARLGLDSASAVALAGDLEDWLGVEIDPTMPYDYPTIKQLAGALAAAAD